MPRPSHAESARTLVEHHDQASLSTLGRASGAPYTSIVEYTPLANGDALLFVSDLADHTKNLDDDERASMLVAEDLGAPQPLTRGRTSLVGHATECDENRRDELAQTYLDTHPHAELYIDFDDFGFYRFSPERIRYIGGFGHMGWVEAPEYRDAEPDPVWPAADDIADHMNDDHPDALLEIARGPGALDWAERARLVAIDRYGFEIEAEGEADGTSRNDEIRLPFDDPLDDARSARTAFIAILDRIRRD